jgi:hypothetical protein
MFRLHLQGLTICMASKSKLTALMLNSGARKKFAPFHLQTLFVRPTAVDWTKTTLRRLPTIEGRWKSTASDSEFRGFDVSGLLIRVGKGGAPVEAQSTAVGLEHPVSKTKPDWSDMHWVLDGKRLLPSGKLAIRRALGEDVLSLAEIRGGRLEGGVPQDPFGSQFVWFLRAGYQQALTDTLDIVYDDAVPTVTFSDAQGKPAGRVVFKKGSEAWLTNDANELDGQFATSATPPKSGKKQQQKKTTPELGDPGLMLEVFRGTPRDMKKVRPRAVRNWKTGLSFSGPSCPLMLVR